MEILVELPCDFESFSLQSILPRAPVVWSLKEGQLNDKSSLIIAFLSLTLFLG